MVVLCVLLTGVLFHSYLVKTSKKCFCVRQISGAETKTGSVTVKIHIPLSCINVNLLIVKIKLMQRLV